MSARSFWPNQHDDWPVALLARVMLDMPKRLHLMLHSPWEMPLAPIFERRTKVMLQEIAAGEHLPYRKLRRTLKDGRREIHVAAEALDRMFADMRLFDQMAFTRSQIETMPDG